MVMYDDPRILRAIAHPTRNRVLHELSAAGSLRAADIARLLDIPANQAHIYRLSGDYAADIRDYEHIHRHILEMADMLSAGIIRQFPHRFR